MLNNRYEAVRQEIQNLPLNLADPNTPSNYPKMNGNRPWIIITALILFFLAACFIMNPPQRVSSTLKLGPLKLQNNAEW